MNGLEAYSFTLNVDMSGFLTGLSDLLMVVIAGVGLYLAHRGLGHYLVSEKIKQQTQKIQQENQKASKRCAEFINAILSKKSQTQPISKQDLDSIKSSIRQLYYASQGTSSEIQSKLFLLMQVVQELKPSYQFGTSSLWLVDNEILYFVTSVCESVIDDAQRIVDLPVSSNLSDSDLHPRIQKLGLFDNRQGKKLKYNFGLNVSPKSEDVFIFYWSLMSRLSLGMIGTKTICKTLGNNLPAAMSLLIYRIYVPPVLQSKNSDLNSNRFSILNTFSGEPSPLFLTCIQSKTKLNFEDGTKQKIWHLTYANLDNVINSNTKSWLDKLKLEGFDPVTESVQFNSLLDSFTQEADGSITIKIEDSKVTKLNWKNKRLERKLKSWIKKQG